MWDAFFYTYIAILAPLFLALGIISTMLLIKRKCARLQTKLFFTIYTCIAILGYSRAVWLTLDPFGLVGFIGDSFPGWFIISRVIEPLGFPSLDTSYTLIIVALLKIRTRPREPWHYQWRLILPVGVSIYAIVLIAEVLSLTVPYPGVIAVVVCQYLLAAGGIIFCLLFFIVGNRLLRKLNRSENRSVRSSDAPTSAYNPNADIAKKFMAKELQRHQAKTRRTKRKIVIITYATVVICIIYSLLTAARATLTTHLLFGSCLGYLGQRGSSAAWLVLEISQKITEVLLALVLLYSVTDLSSFSSCSRNTIE